MVCFGVKYFFVKKSFELKYIYFLFTFLYRKSGYFFAVCSKIDLI
jgi:hypothetical protein